MTAAAPVRLSRILNTVRIGAEDGLDTIASKLRRRLELARLHRNELGLRLEKSRVYLEAVRLQCAQALEQGQRLAADAEGALREQLAAQDRRRRGLQDAIAEQTLAYQRSGRVVAELKDSAMQRFNQLQQSIDALRLRLRHDAGPELAAQLDMLRTMASNATARLE